MNEQLPLDGIAPAKMARRRQPADMHPLPTAEDAEALRAFVSRETSPPGTLMAQLEREGIRGAAALKAMKDIRRKLTMTEDERTRLLLLADRWERDAKEREHG